MPTKKALVTIATVATIVLCTGLPGAIASEPSPAVATLGEPVDPMLAMLRKRVQSAPDHSDSWRLLGKYQAKTGNLIAAIDSLSQALTLDPENAAAHHDMGHTLQMTNDPASAMEHFRRCAEIAPASRYANELYAQGIIPRPAKLNRSPTRIAAPDTSSSSARKPQRLGAGSPEMNTVGYRIQTFDGAEGLEQRFEELRSDADPELQRLRVFLETGVLYNSNVSLTPISRGLANVDAESLQGFVSPELEWIARERGRWRTGLLTGGFFSVNEESQSEFDLASFQPGAFLERDLTVGTSEWIARLDYEYSLDLLDGKRFGDRHRLGASLVMIRPDLDVIYAYVATTFSQFDDDGTTPSVTSLDGPAITAGISRFFQTQRSWAPTYSLGMDLGSTDTEGSDFRFRSIDGYGNLTLQLRDCLQLIPSVGVGYRDFYAFSGPVNRDELTWRVQGKLRYQWSQRTAFSIVAGHDRFASDNQDFDSERTQGGVIATISY